MLFVTSPVKSSMGTFEHGEHNKTDVILIIILSSLRSLRCTLHINGKNTNLQNTSGSRCTLYISSPTK